MLAGLAAPGTISPVEGLRTSVPALRAGTFCSTILKWPGKVNSPMPLGWIEPVIAFSMVASTPLAASRLRPFSSAIRLTSAVLVSASLTGLDLGAAGLALDAADLAGAFLLGALAKRNLLMRLGQHCY